MSIALPVLSITYVLISIIVVAFNYKSLGSVFTLIFNDAMHPRSISGGIIGSFCLCARKCCLSHETGLGTSGIVHALSPEKDSFKEALRSMMTPLITGLIVCLSTALVLTTTGTYNDAEIMKDGVSALSYAFGSTYWLFSYVVVAIIPMFTANVMIGWSNYIVKCSQYILNKKQFAHMMTILFFTFAFIGGIINDFFFVMDVVDLILMFILLINVPIIMVLSGKVYKAIKEYKF
jgi:AGCS family alanine or glycine:cation symporter